MGWNEPGKNNGKDPWGGQNDGPPDLDEALRKLQNKFKKMFSGGGKSNGSDAGGESSGGGIGITLIAIVALGLWFISGIFIVDPAEESVILRFGKYSETVGPGPHWMARFIDTKYTLNVQKVSNFSYTAQMLTKDENIVSVAVAVQYRISDPNKYLFNIVNPIESIQQATASSLRQVIGHTTLDQILTKGREEVRQQTSKQLKHILNIYQTGLEVTDVVMQPAKPPEEVKAAFDDAIKAQEDEQRFINQAQAYKRGVVPIAQGRSKRIFQEANAYKQRVILAATGEASRFKAILNEYSKAPRVTRERMYLDALEKILEHTNKVMVDVKGSNNMLYLPLDQIMKRSRQDAELAKLSAGQSSSMNISSSTNRKSAVGSSSTQRSSYRGRAGRDSYQGRGTY